MFKVNTNVLIVSMICCTALIIFFYYQHNTPYNQCVRAHINDNEPKYFSNSKDAFEDIVKTKKENNFYRVIPSYRYQPQPISMDEPFNVRHYGVEPVLISSEERMAQITRSANLICSKRLSN